MGKETVKSKHPRWLYRSKIQNGEYYCISQIWSKAYNSRIINFWHVVGDQHLMFTFLPNPQYNTKTQWTEDLCKELKSEMQKPKSEINVIRIAVNGSCVFKSDLLGADTLPQLPEWLINGKIDDREYIRGKRWRTEKAKAQEPAPYILYGKHKNDGKELSWKLTPDVEKRQGIVPGDRVLVWTRHGYKQVTVTRIEPTGEQEEPTARVKKKLPPEEWE